VEATAAAPAEERKVVTVLFADLVGSTALGDQDPERTRALLDRFYDAMASEIERAGGTVEKFAGDAVMAAFGAPAAHEDHAERALHAALALQRRMDELFGGDLELRVGVNTGEVVVGRAREGSSFVTGDAVNVCARLEQHARPGEVLVGERTVQAARGAFEFEQREPLVVKGKAQPVACRRLVRALTLMRPRGVGALKRAFVGRESELELLQATYRRVLSDGHPHAVTLMGAAGVGKTRLVRELWEWLGDQRPEPLRRTGRCLPYGRGITYWPLGEMLKEHLGLLESDPPEVVLERLGKALSLALGFEPEADTHPLAARDRLHAAWIEFVEDLAADRPVVLLLEDLHWAEEPLLDLVERLLREARGPVLLVATARPELLERRATWGGGRRNSSLLWLEPLTPSDSEQLLVELLGGDAPAELRQVVVAHAEGNPFFVEEVISTLIDRGVLARSDGGWTVDNVPADFEIPDSVQAVLAARIDLLPPTEKAALQAAAVAGRLFWEGPVRAMVEGGEPDLELLEERDFIRRRPGSGLSGEREYAIKHALTREVAYSSLPKTRRARLHAAFAEWLEEHVEAQDETASFLAHHYAEAVRGDDADLAWSGEEARLAALSEKALVWLRRAADLAIRRYELHDAIALLRQAVELEPRADERAAIWREVGQAHALGYEGEPFWEAMQSSLATSTDRAVRADTYSVLALQTAVRSGMWKRRPDQALVESWIREALELAEPGSPAHARALVARANWAEDAYGADEAARAAREASAVADDLGDVELRSWALEARAAAAAAASRYDEAWGWAQRRFELVPELQDPDHVMEIHEGLVPSCAAVGKLAEARRLAEAADEHARRLSPHHRVHGVALRLEAGELAGDWETVRALRSRVEEAVAANLETPCARNARSLLVSALASAALGDAAAAAELEREADELGMEGYEYALSGPRLRLALIRGELSSVGDLGHASAGHGVTFGLAVTSARLDAFAALRDRERVEEQVEAVLRPRTYLEPFALRALGIVRDDERLIAQAHERFDALGLRWHADQTERIVSAYAGGS